MSLIKSKLKTGVSEVKIQITYKGAPPVLAGYVYKLIANNSNAPLDYHQGDNQNSQDDLYSLPTPVMANKNRMITLTSSVAAINSDADYVVQIDVIQDGAITDTLKSYGKVVANGGASINYDGIKFI